MTSLQRRLFVSFPIEEAANKTLKPPTRGSAAALPTLAGAA
ncbi:MAG: hypothetical protein ACREVY_12960 [Gammaproteobacteria bacterium]